MGNTPTPQVRVLPGCLHRGAFARYSAFNTQISDKLLALRPGNVNQDASVLSERVDSRQSETGL